MGFWCFVVEFVGSSYCTFILFSLVFICNIKDKSNSKSEKSNNTKRKITQSKVLKFTLFTHIFRFGFFSSPICTKSCLSMIEAGEMVLVFYWKDEDEFVSCVTLCAFCQMKVLEKWESVFSDFCLLVFGSPKVYSCIPFSFFFFFAIGDDALWIVHPLRKYTHAFNIYNDYRSIFTHFVIYGMPNQKINPNKKSLRNRVEWNGIFR